MIAMKEQLQEYGIPPAGDNIEQCLVKAENLQQQALMKAFILLNPIIVWHPVANQRKRQW